MIAYILGLLETYIIPLGAFGVFAASFIEEIIAPIPSAVVQTISGFLFVTGDFSFSTILHLVFVVVLPAALGVTLGSLFVFGIAYWFGKPALLRFGKWLGVSWADIERAQKKFEQTSADEWTLFLTRSIPIIPSVAISALCGLMRISLKKYLLYTFLGTCVRAFVLAIVGWQVGELYSHYAKAISRVENIVFAAFIVAVVIFIIWRIKASRKITSPGV